MEGAFSRGAHAVLGWPIDDAINANAARTGKAMQISWREQLPVTATSCVFA